MRWNDYGIACLLETGLAAELGELRQAEEAFRQVIELGKPDGWTNLARVYLKDGRVQDAEYALTQASENELQFPWVATWLGARVAAENSNLDSAIELYQAVLDTRIPRRRFDFSNEGWLNDSGPELPISRRWTSTWDGSVRSCWARARLT